MRRTGWQGRRDRFWRGRDGHDYAFSRSGDWINEPKLCATS